MLFQNSIYETALEWFSMKPVKWMYLNDTRDLCLKEDIQLILEFYYLTSMASNTNTPIVASNPTTNAAGIYIYT